MIGWIALVILAVVGLVGFEVVLARLARAAAAETARARRAVRISADRDVVEGRRPLPPGVDLDHAYARAAARGIPVADAAFEIHRDRVRAIIGKALRPPRPGD